MKKVVLGVAVLVAVLFALSVVEAADQVTVKGTVKATKNDEGVVTAVTVTAGEVVYSVALDDKGKEVAKLDGKLVEVKGTVEEKDGKKVMTVTECKEVVEEK